MMRKLIAAAASSTLLVSGLAAWMSTGSAQADQRPTLRPVIFVHGGSGSGAQYETAARRFASNGYPVDRIEAHDYDSTLGSTTVAQIHEGLDARIARLLEKTGADKVDLLGHSFGTGIAQSYLRSTPERAAKVAHYVNLDGATSTSLPGGVPTLAIWGEGSTTRSITGAKNVYLSDQAHTQTVTSAESFAEQYEFFTGKKPRTTQVLPERHITIAGRAVQFPSNIGAANATLEIYEVNPRTGKRLHKRPIATKQLSGDGSWGPYRARGSATYEFSIVRPAGTHHLYFQPFRRSDHLIRLLTSEPGTGVDLLVERSDRHSSLVVNRYKEWWGDQGEGSDVLSIEGTNVLNAATSPRTKRAIGLFAFDAGSDGVSHTDAPLAAFTRLIFITGVDLFVKAANPPDDAVRVEVRQRGCSGRPDVINVPNFASSQHRMSLQFNDYCAASRHGKGSA
jgi:poly(3-hydroxybutyrate) depolymerase